MEAIMSKLDLNKTDKNYYHAGAKPDVRDFDCYYYLSIEGKSAPENQLFLSAIEAIYGIAYGIKFICKGEDNDFVVPKMECHWFIDGGPEIQHQFAATPRDQWRWKILLRMPDFVEGDHFFRAMENLKNKKRALADFINLVKYELINEGKCAQIMHLGSYDEEGPTLEKIHGFIKNQGLTIIGYHKEIYISDPRRTPAHKMKTILRYQVK